MKMADRKREERERERWVALCIDGGGCAEDLWRGRKVVDGVES